MRTLDYTQEVADVLQREYGDASQTVLDRKVAAAIIHHLREIGWFSPDEVRAVVASAGGRIDVQERHLVDPPAELHMSVDEFHTGVRTLTTR